MISKNAEAIIKDICTEITDQKKASLLFNPAEHPGFDRSDASSRYSERAGQSGWHT